MLPNIPAMLGDWEFVVSVVAPAAFTETLLCPADPSRWYLAFSSPDGGGQLVGTLPSLVGGTGVVLPATGFLEWKFKDCGPVCQQEWFAFAAAGGRNITVYTAAIRLRGPREVEPGP